MNNPILTALNKALKVTNLFGTSNPISTSTLDGLPLGTVGGTATGEIAVKVLSLGGASPGFNIPSYDYTDIGYVGSTNNIATVVYKTGGSGGTTVATLTMTYIGGTPSTNDALLDTVTRS